MIQIVMTVPFYGGHIICGDQSKRVVPPAASVCKQMSPVIGQNKIRTQRQVPASMSFLLGLLSMSNRKKFDLGTSRSPRSK
jgi:hypothetical protein